MVNTKGQMGMIAIVIAIVLVLGIGIYMYSNGSFGSSSSSNIYNNPGSSSSNSGRVVFAMTDAAANMGSVSSVMVTVDNVEAHSTTEGWVTITSNAKTYDLIELKNSGEFAVIADTNVKAGMYDQIRFDVSDVTIVDDQGEHEAKLPSNKIMINSNMDVNESGTATATFDFIADDSVHVTGNGKYILAPVIQVETRSDAEVESKSNNRVVISSGNVKTKVKVGMDMNGNVGVGLKLPSNVDIGTDGKIKVGLGLGNSNSANSSGNAGASGSANSHTGVGLGY